MKTGVKEVLTEAKRVITDVGWCQGSSRQTADGVHLMLADVKAGVEAIYKDEKGEVREPTAFCLFGAVEHASYVMDGPFIESMFKIRQTLFGNDFEVGKTSIIGWNDEAGRKKEDVLAALDKAIEAAI